MKKTAPIALAVLIGVYALAEFYIPDWHVRWVTTELQSWAAVVAAFAYVLGGINLIQVNFPKIKRRERDWGYKVVMVTAAVAMGLAGIKWHKILGSGPSGSVEIAKAGVTPIVPAGKARVVVDAPGDVMVQVGKEVARPELDAQGRGYTADVEPGTVAIKVSRRVGGYADYTTEVELAPGAVARVTADPQMVWGASGRVYGWLYDHVFAPCNATMFALLAFFVVSAAFRAFRMRNVEATLLLGSAILTLLACAPIGRWLSSDLVAVKQWILDIPNNGGRRAIMMGAAIGAIATSLRIILGLERSHLGAD